MKRMASGVVAILVLSLMVSAAAMAQGNANVAGKWESKFTTPQGEMTTTFTFKQDGDKLTGTVAGGRGGETPLEGTVKGKEVKFTVTRQTPNGDTMKTEYTATVEGDTMKGTAEGPRGKRDWSATKAK